MQPVLNPSISQVVSDVNNLKKQIDAGINQIKQTPLAMYSDSPTPVIELFKIAILNEKLRDNMYAENCTFSNVGVNIITEDLSIYGFDVLAVRFFSQDVFKKICKLLKQIPEDNLARAANSVSGYDYSWNLESYHRKGLLPHRQMDSEAGGFLD